jgi:hypothetical protein
VPAEGAPVPESPLPLHPTAKAKHAPSSARRNVPRTEVFFCNMEFLV